MGWKRPGRGSPVLQGSQASSGGASAAPSGESHVLLWGTHLFGTRQTWSLSHLANVVNASESLTSKVYLNYVNFISILRRKVLRETLEAQTRNWAHHRGAGDAVSANAEPAGGDGPSVA